MSLLDLPDEVLGLILVKCASRDVLSMANTCRRLSKVANDIFLWQQLSERELSSSGLQLPPSFRQPHQAHRREVQLGVQAMKRRLQRLRRILPKITKCKTCKHLTCQQEAYCHEDRVVLDVGSKTTWCLGPNSLWQKHPSVLIGDQHGNCLTCEHSDKLKPQAMLHTKFHGNIRPHSHHQPLLPQFGTQDLVSSFANLRKDGRAGFSSASGVFDDMFNVVKSINPESYLRHPLKCLQGDRGDEGGCTVFEDFISHILKKFQVTQNLQQANSSLVFCEPYFMTTAQRRKLCKFFFESTGAGRLCFLNKAYSTAALTQIETCIVVDSGCHSTVVSVVINGQVQPERTQHRPIGGQLLSENLLDRLRMRQWDCPVSCEGLDNHQVKVSCYLSANIDLEHTTVYDEVFKQCFVQCQRGGLLTQEWVEFGSELYIAPELMYTAMQLPDMILKAVRGLPRFQIQQLVTHILLTGANTELTGFRRRLVSDLRRKMPDFAHLNMHTYSGSRSWECCMGGTCLLLANTSDPMTLFPVDSYVCNTYQWITREDYILYGESAVRNE